MRSRCNRRYRSGVLSSNPGLSTLWLPLRKPRLAWGAASLTTALYVLGMARDLSFYDSAELALTAVQLGLAHPPGQPLYMLLGHVFAHLAPGDPLLGLNFLSALSGGLTILPALSLAERMVEAELEGERGWVLPAALVLGSQHAALWEQATRVEVYALAVLFALWCLARGAHLLDVGGRARLPWLGLGLGLGLCAAVNPVLAAFASLCGLPGTVVALKAGRVRAIQPGFALLGSALGLVCYAYVPLVASRTDVLVWGAPTSGAALVDYLSARDFRSNLHVPIGTWLAQVVGWLAFSLEFTLLPLWGVGLVAHALTPPRGLTRGLAPLSCALAVAYLARYVHFVPQVPDYVSYASMASWLCMVGFASLVAWLWARSTRFAALALIAVLLASVLSAPPSVLSRTRARERTARAIASALLASAPPRALIVAGADHWVAPLWYLQQVERQRPDVVVLATGLLSSSWYFEHLFRNHPTLARAPLRGSGGQLGRLARVLASNAGRPVLFEDPDLARALGLTICVHRFFAAARTTCSDAVGERIRAAALWERLQSDVGEGEPTALGVLAEVSYRRGQLLATFGYLQAALRTLLVPLGKPPTELGIEALTSSTPQRLVEPAWQRPAPLGDPARNLFAAASLAFSVGLPRQALVWMLAARERGLPEAEAWLTARRAGGLTVP